MQLKRRSTISSSSNRSRLLPAMPVRRKPQTATKLTNKPPPSRSAGNSNRNSLCLIEDSSEVAEASELGETDSEKTTSIQDLPEVTCKNGGMGSGRATPVGVGLLARQNSNPTGSAVSVNGKTERPTTPKSKHTVQYSGKIQV